MLQGAVSKPVSPVIKLFVSDIDGCLAVPYQAFDLEAMRILAAFARQAESTGDLLPRLSLCSGRAYAYVEAMTQLLGLRAPVLFESGGGMFDPDSAQVFWNPAFTHDAAEQIDAVRHWLEAEFASTSLMLDHGKRTQAGIISADLSEVEAAVPVVEAYVAEHFPSLCSFHTPVSIDVLATGVTKRQAMGWLADHLDIELDEIAYIGDSNGDLGALEAVGFSFAPANATPAVKAQVNQVTVGAVVDGVLEAYRWCVAHRATTLLEVT